MCNLGCVCDVGIVGSCRIVVKGLVVVVLGRAGRLGLDFFFEWLKKLIMIQILINWFFTLKNIRKVYYWPKIKYN